MVESIVAALSALLGVYMGFILQQHTEKKKVAEQRKVSASMIYIDIVGFIEDVKDYEKNSIFQGFCSHSNNYSQHIANLEDKLSEKEVRNLHHVYGYIMRMQKATNDGIGKEVEIKDGKAVEKTAAEKTALEKTTAFIIEKFHAEFDETEEFDLLIPVLEKIRSLKGISAVTAHKVDGNLKL